MYKVVSKTVERDGEKVNVHWYPSLSQAQRAADVIKRYLSNDVRVEN